MPTLTHPHETIELTMLGVEDLHTRGVVELDEPSATADSVVLHGIDADVSSLCGECGAPLIEGADPAALSSVAIRCGECAAASGFVAEASGA